MVKIHWPRAQSLHIRTNSQLGYETVAINTAGSTKKKKNWRKGREGSATTFIPKIGRYVVCCIPIVEHNWW